LFTRASGEDRYVHELDSIKRLSNVKILDFSRSDDSDDKFIDAGHLNAAGAAAFLYDLREALKVAAIMNDVSAQEVHIIYGEG
jgi:hypothetical protein